MRCRRRRHRFLSSSPDLDPEGKKLLLLELRVGWHVRECREVMHVKSRALSKFVTVTVVDDCVSDGGVGLRS